MVQTEVVGIEEEDGKWHVMWQWDLGTIGRRKDKGWPGQAQTGRHFGSEVSFARCCTTFALGNLDGVV